MTEVHKISAKMKGREKRVHIFTFHGSAERGISRAKMEAALSGIEADFSDYQAERVEE